MAKAEVVISAVDRTQAALQSAQKGFKGLNDSALLLKKTLGAVSIAAAGAFVTRTITQAVEFGDQINKAAVRAGVAAETMSELSYAAKLSGVDINAVVKSLQFMQKGLVEAAMNTGEAKRALDMLGVSAKDVSSMSIQKQFEFFADKIAGIENPTQRGYVVMKLFGEAGLQLLPMLEQGAAGLQKFAEEAKRLGLVFNDEQLNRLTAQKDAVDKLSMSWQAFVTRLTSEVAPALTTFFNRLSGADEIYELELSIARMQQSVAQLNSTFQFDAAKDMQDAISAAQKRLEELRKQASEPLPIKPTAVIAPEDLTIGKLQEEENTRFLKGIEKRIKQEQDLMEAVRMGLIEARDANYEALMQIVPDIPDMANQQFTILEKLASAAAQNIQTSFANFLFDPFQNGIKGMLKGFVDMIRRMIAEIAASMILTKFFSWMSGLGGFWGSIGGAAVKSLTGKAMGGSVMGGTPYMVGERGPELFVPGSNGSIVPNDRMGGTTIAPIYNIDARGATADLQKALPGILQENNRRIFDELDRRYGIGR